MRKKPTITEKRKLKKFEKAQVEQEIKALTEIIEKEKPLRGINPLIYDDDEKPDSEHIPLSKDYKLHFPAAKTFEELPLSKFTQSALKEHNFILLTRIQRVALPHALSGRDILGSAATGSGKTLAFLLPTIELLFRNKRTPLDGLCAIILSPTRELAAQIYTELTKLLRYHSLSAGCLIGGKSVTDEASNIRRLNIVVATPGRLLHHLDQTPNFDTFNVELLILDEADRMLDMGFREELRAIIEHLPPNHNRQTLLFSATQTKSLRQLEILALRQPEYVFVDHNSLTHTPVALKQFYIMIPLEQKVDVLTSFIRSHKSSKTLVFCATCKEVRFLFEFLRRFRPGISVLHIHGKMSQQKRLDLFLDFTNHKHAVMIATDVASRGLDIPSVDWVVQFDCPDDTETYIHRVGRTARYLSSGQGLLFLLESEKKMVDLLRNAKVPIKQMKLNPKMLLSYQAQLRGFVFKDYELKYLAQKAFISYMRSIYLQKNKDIFDVSALSHQSFALSLGLMTVPVIKFLKDGKGVARKNQKNSKRIQIQGEIEREEPETKKKEKVKAKDPITKMFTQKNQSVLSEKYNKHLETLAEDDDLLVLKDAKDSLHTRLNDQIFHSLSKKKKKNPLKLTFLGSRTTFSSDDEGEGVKIREKNIENQNSRHEIDFNKVVEEMKNTDQIDKQVQKVRLKAKKLQKRIKRGEKIPRTREKKENEFDPDELNALKILKKRKLL